MSIKEISKELMRAVTGGHPLELQVLDFSHNHIQRIDNLSELKKLRRLNLSHNQLQSVQGLQEMKLLTHLNVSHNQITELKGLKSLVSLTQLNLRFNKLQSIVDLQELISLQSLCEIDVQGNDNLTSIVDYRVKIKEILPQLTRIDGMVFGPGAITFNVKINKEITENLENSALHEIILKLEAQISQQITPSESITNWRKKCQELLMREKINVYRYNKQEEENRLLCKQRDQLRIEQVNMRDQMKELASFTEEKEQQHQKQLGVIFSEFDGHSKNLLRLLDQKLKQQEKRLFDLEGGLLQQKKKLLNKRIACNQEFVEFKQMLKTLAKTFSATDIESDIDSPQFVYDFTKFLRNSLLQLQDSRHTISSQAAKHELHARQEELLFVNQEKMQLQNKIIDKEQEFSQQTKSWEMKLSLLNIEAEAKQKKYLEIYTSKQEQEQKAEQEKRQLYEKIELFEETASQCKIGYQESKHEISRLKSEVQQRIQQIRTVENQLSLERENKNLYSKQCNDLMRLVEKKDAQIKQLRDVPNSQNPNTSWFLPQPDMVSRSHSSSTPIYNNQYQINSQQLHQNTQQQHQPQHHQLLAMQMQNTKNSETRTAQTSEQNGVRYMRSGTKGTVLNMNQTDRISTHMQGFGRSTEYEQQQRLQQRLNQTEVFHMNTGGARGKDWSPQPRKQNIFLGQSAQLEGQIFYEGSEANNFGSNKATNMIIGDDLSIINANEHIGGLSVGAANVGLALDDELRFRENEGKAFEILDDSL